VKIGKVQSARRRHWRDVKENEREVGSGQKGNYGAPRWRIEEKRERERTEKARMREAAGDIVSAVYSDCVRFYGTRQLARNESIVREELNRVPPRI